MSTIHQCNDGTEDITGRATPNKIPCENQGGVVSTDTTGPIGPVGENLQSPRVGPSPTNKKDKKTQLVFFIVAAGTFAIVGHWAYNKYINK